MEHITAIAKFLNRMTPEEIQIGKDNIEALMLDLGFPDEDVHDFIDSAGMSGVGTPPAADKTDLDIAVSALGQIANTITLSMSMVLDMEHGFTESRAQVIKLKTLAKTALGKIGS